MRAKQAFEFPARGARARVNALVDAYMTVTELLSLLPCDVVERDHVLSFLLDQICRTAKGSQVNEEALVVAALHQFARGFPRRQ